MKKITAVVLATMLATSAYGSDTYKRLGPNRYEGVNPAAEMWLEKSIIQRERNRKMRQRLAEEAQQSHSESYVGLPVIKGPSVESRVHQLDGVDEDPDEIALEERYQQLLAKDPEYRSLQVKRTKRFASPEMEAFQDQWDGLQPGEREQRFQDQMHNIEIRLRRLALKNFQNEQQLAEERRLEKEAVHERISAGERPRERTPFEQSLDEARERDQRTKDKDRRNRTSPEPSNHAEKLKAWKNDYPVAAAKDSFTTCKDALWSSVRWFHSTGRAIIIEGGEYSSIGYWRAFYEHGYLYDYSGETQKAREVRKALEAQGREQMRQLVQDTMADFGVYSELEKPVEKTLEPYEIKEILKSKYMMFTGYNPYFEKMIEVCDSFTEDVKKALPHKTKKQPDDRFKGMGILVSRYKKFQLYYLKYVRMMLQEYHDSMSQEKEKFLSEDENILNNL